MITIHSFHILVGKQHFTNAQPISSVLQIETRNMLAFVSLVLPMVTKQEYLLRMTMVLPELVN
jgi:hypothetical protein